MPPEMSITFHTKAYHQGQTVFNEGQAGSYACIINFGRVAVVKELAGEKVTLAVLGRGAVFGEMALVAEERRTATVLALEYTEVVIVERHRLIQALGQATPLVQALVQGLVERLRDTTNMVRKQYDLADKLDSLAHLIQAWLETVPLSSTGAACLPVSRLLEFAQVALRMPPHETESLLRELRNHQVAEMAGTSKGRELVLDRPDKLMQRMRGLSQRLYAESEVGQVRETVELFTDAPEGARWLDLYQLSQEMDLEPSEVLDMVASGDIPNSLVMFPRIEALAWARQWRESNAPRQEPPAALAPVPEVEAVIGELFPEEAPQLAAQEAPAPTAQEKAEEARQRARNLEPLERLLDAEGPRLQRALAFLDFDTLLILVSGASLRARRLILDNLGLGLAREVRSMLPDLKLPPSVHFEGALDRLAQELHGQGN